MKYLSHYTQEAQTKLFEETGVFFAFSDSQFKEKKKEGVKYVSLNAGIICPIDNVDALIDGLGNIQKRGIEADIAENGIKGIIHRELGNHEAQITNDIEDTCNALDGYGITEEQVRAEYKEFFQKCIDNDWF